MNEKNRAGRLTLALMGFFLMVLTACSTVVSVTEYVPAAIDMGDHRVLAVASTKPYTRSIDTPRWVRVPGDWPGWASGVVSGVDADVKDKTAAYATQQILRTLSSAGYFTIIGPEITDSVMNLSQSGWGGNDVLRQRGVDAVMTSSINYMDVSETLSRQPVYEYIEVDLPGGLKEKKRVIVRYDYIITQIVTLDLTYTLTDLKDGRVITSKQMIDKQTRDTRLSSSSSLAPSVTPAFRSIVDGFQKTVASQLVPRYYSRTESLMDNSPKNGTAQAAYKMVSQGNTTTAYSIFRQEWDLNRHIPSGYNASVLLYSQGKLEEAYDLMRSVYEVSGNGRAYNMLQTIRTTLNNREKVQEQMN